MKFKEVCILYDQNGDVTNKLGKDVVAVLILPKAQILTSYSKNLSYKYENEENVCRIEKQKLKSIRLLVAVNLKQIGDECFYGSMLEKFIGDSLEKIGKESF